MQRVRTAVRERPAVAGAVWLFLAVNVANALAYGYQVAMLRLLTPADFALLVSLFAALIIESQGITLLQSTAAKVVADRKAVEDLPAIRAFAISWGRRIGVGALVPAVVIAALAPFVAGATGFPLSTTWMLAASLVFAALFAFGAGLLQGLGSFWSLGLVYILQAGTRLVLGVGLVLVGLGVAGAFAGATAAIALSFLAALLVLRGGLPAAAAGASPSVGGLLLGAATLLLFYALLVNVDALLAPLLLPPDEAGAYAAAVTMGKIALFAPLGLSYFLLERTAAAHALGRSARRLLVLVLLAVLAVSGAVALVYLVLPDLSARIVAGPERAPAVARIVGTYGIAALSNALLQVWAVYLVGVGRLRLGVVFLIGAVGLVAVLTLVARDPLTMARSVLATTLAVQAVVVGWFLWTRA